MSKILILSNMYPSKQNPTYGIFVKNQVEYLSKVVSLEKVVITDSSKNKRKYFIWFFKTIHRLVTDKSIKLIHVHYAFPTGIPALIAKIILNIPYIVTVHGGDYYKMAKRNRILFFLVKLILQKASKIIVVGEDLKLLIESEMNIVNNILILNMGVNTNIFKPAPVKEPNSVKRILYVGNYLESKGLMDLVDSLVILKEKSIDFRFELIGNRKSEEFYQSVMRKLKQSDIDYKDYGSKSQNFIADMMNYCDVIVIPSHFEGFGLVALEAMACKLPIIASNVGGLRYLVYSTGVLFEAKDIYCLASNIEEYIINEKYSADYIEKGYQRALENTYEKVNYEIIKIYEEYIS